MQQVGKSKIACVAALCACATVSRAESYIDDERTKEEGSLCAPWTVLDAPDGTLQLDSSSTTDEIKCDFLNDLRKSHMSSEVRKMILHRLQQDPQPITFS